MAAPGFAGLGWRLISGHGANRPVSYGLGAKLGVESNQKTTAETNAAAVRPTYGPGRLTYEPWQPQSGDDKAAVRAQLDLLLVHSLFFQSKRYPALLRFVVEQTLEGNADQVKERLIGMEVFGRAPGYDANADPVVRVTAGEIRKRLAQYYYDPAHGEEIRIELPPGSYVPVFQKIVPVEPDAPVEVKEGAEGLAAESSLRSSASNVPPLVRQEPLAVGRQDKQHRDAEHVGAGQVGTGPQRAGHSTSSVLVINFLLAALALSLGLAGGYWLHAYRQSQVKVSANEAAGRAANQALDDFWAPMTAGPATVTFCLGEPARDSSGDTDPAQTIQHPKLTEPLYFRLRQSGLFALADVVTLTRMSAILQRQEKSFRVSAASEASFAQLREGPAVLIGAYDNLWTMRLTRDLRFGFDSIDGNAFILDRKPKQDGQGAGKQGKTEWFTAWDQPYEKLARDYAIVARYHDSMTGQPVVIAAGISEEGTEAAGELISNPADLANLLEKAPANWRTMNMEAVIETQVIDGHAGPPQVRAFTFW